MPGRGTIDVNVKFDGAYCETIPPLKPDEVVAVYAPVNMTPMEAQNLREMTARWLGVDSERVAVFCNGTRLKIVEKSGCQATP